MSTMKRYFQHLGSVTKHIVAKRRKGESTVNSTTKDFLANNRKNWKTMWSEKDILLAEELHERGVSTADIAIELRRSDGSILTMLSKRRNEYPAVMRHRGTTPEEHQTPSAEDNIIIVSAIFDKLQACSVEIARLEAALKEAQDKLAMLEQPHNIARQATPTLEFAIRKQLSGLDAALKEAWEEQLKANGKALD
jgi:hypothetical protein